MYLFIYLFIYWHSNIIITHGPQLFQKKFPELIPKLLDLIYLLTQPSSSLGDELVMPFQHVLLG